MEITCEMIAEKVAMLDEVEFLAVIRMAEVLIAGASIEDALRIANEFLVFYDREPLPLSIVIKS